MQLRLTEESVDFLWGERLAGSYCYTDCSKCYVHPLNSPKGYTVSLKSPQDHIHHKGLMYGLRTDRINFWEEYSTMENELVGCQRHIEFVSIISKGNCVGFAESISWETRHEAPVIMEQRTVHCAVEEGQFVWKWACELQVKEDIRLITSQWSKPDKNGRLVNYHGLGLRFRPEFAQSDNQVLSLDGKPTSFRDALGQEPQEVRYSVKLVDANPAEGISVTLSATPKTGFFAIDDPFVYLSLGPTILGGFNVRAGERICNAYELRISDSI
jgi:Methane oxygenase PmoA